MKTCFPLLLAACLAAGFAPGTVAAQGEVGTAPAALDAAAIRAQQQQIRADAEARKGRYAKLPDAKRTDLYRRQDRVDTLIKDVTLTTELDETRRIELFNNLEAISAIVNQAEDERMICQRHRPIGSNRPTTICKSVAQRRADREFAERNTNLSTLECDRTKHTCF